MPSANYLAELAKRQQDPVHFLRIDDLASKDYSTHPVLSAATPKTVLMEVPRGGGGSLDLVSAAWSVQEVELELLDKNGEITAMIATEAPGAPLASLVNRKATVYGGFRPLVEADYEPRFTGRIRRVRRNDRGTGFVLTLSDLGYLLSGRIMLTATADKPASIRGNPVNVYWSLLTGTFDTGHATFPLEFVSTASANSVAPTGLGIATSLINEAQLVSERDTWHAGDVVHVVWTAPEDARAHLTNELFRVFQSYPAISATGLLGLRFHVPSLPIGGAVAVSEREIVEIHSWERLFDDHMNRFTVMGDWSDLSRTYERVLYQTSDAADQSETGETIEYLAESRWLRQAHDGEGISWELAERMRLRFLKPPARIEISVLPSVLVAQGDVVKLSETELPDLFTGSLGLVDHVMTVLAVRPEWDTGLTRLTLLDTGGKRYGLISGDAQVDYAAASVIDRETYAFISSDAPAMSDGSRAYGLL